MPPPVNIGLSSDTFCWEDIINIPMCEASHQVTDTIAHHQIESSSPICRKATKFILDEEFDTDECNDLRISQFIQAQASCSDPSVGYSEEETERDSLDGFIVYTQDDEQFNSGYSHYSPTSQIDDFYRYSIQTQADPFFATKKNSLSFQDGRFKFPLGYQVDQSTDYERRYGNALVLSSDPDMQ